MPDIEAVARFLTLVEKSDLSEWSIRKNSDGRYDVRYRVGDDHELGGEGQTLDGAIWGCIGGPLPDNVDVCGEKE